MKHVFKTLAFCLVLLVPASGLCENADSGPRPSGPDLGYKLIHFLYEEPDIDEEGWLNGVHAGYTHRFDFGLMLGAEAEFFAGELDYDGQYVNGTPLTANTDDSLFQVRGLAGWDFTAGAWTLTPYTGLGWRYWNNQIHAPGGYEREIRYLYAPIGLEALISPAERWILSFKAEYDLFLDGQADADFSDIGPGYEDASFDQDFGGGYGLRASVRAAYAFDSFTISLEPFFRYWDVDESDTDTAATPAGPVTWVEPENTTTIFGVLLSVGF